MKRKIKINLDYLLGALATLLCMLENLTRLEVLVVIGSPLFWVSAFLFLRKLLGQQNKAIRKLKDKRSPFII
jgi:sensor histidine kinase YesM